MADIFISYRRDDSRFVAAWLYSELRREFSNLIVFLDHQAMLYGQKINSTLDRELVSSSIVLVLVGPNWLTVQDDKGNLRLHDPEDRVRRELELALSSNKIIIPILIDDTPIPGRGLPEALQDVFSDRNCMYVEANQIDSFFGVLSLHIRRHLQEIERSRNQSKRNEHDKSPFSDDPVRMQSPPEVDLAGASQVPQSAIDDYLTLLEAIKREQLTDPRHKSGDRDISNGVATDNNLEFLLFTPDYNDIHLIQDVASENDILETLAKELFHHNHTWKNVSGAAKVGDKVVCDIEAHLTSLGIRSPFLPATNSDIELQLNSNLKEPFLRALVGVAAGSIASVTIKDLEGFGIEAPAGSELEVRFRLKEVKEPVQVSLKGMGFNSTEEVISFLKKEGRRRLDVAQTQRLKKRLLDDLDKRNRFNVPEHFVRAEHESLWEAQLSELKERNLPIEALGKPMEEAKKELRDLAVRRVKLAIVVTAIARAEKINVTEADIQRRIDEIVANSDEPNAVKDYFARPGNRGSLKGPLLEDAVVSWLLKQAVIEKRHVSGIELLSGAE